MATKETPQELILRDKLALDRTVLANQRTLLSYVRTGIFFVSTALGVFYLEKKVVFGLLEWILIGLGAFCLLLGLIVFFQVRKRIHRLYK